MSSTKKSVANITHVALVLDASNSMTGAEKTLIQVVDKTISSLAQMPAGSDQEVRISVYQFDDPSNIQCLIYDRDVLRMPSISGLYRVTGGWTALIDATSRAIEDLKKIPVMYGDHGFLMFVFTDGHENRSRTLPHQLQGLIRGLPDTWQLASLVPDHTGAMQMQRLGFPAGNIEIWDATTKEGVERAGARVTQATQSYVTTRQSGGKALNITNLFAMDASTVNAQTIKEAGLVPLAPTAYKLVPVNKDKIEARDFVLSTGLPWKVGNLYYQLTKPELVQGDKEIIVVEKATNKVFRGAGARQLVKLSGTNTRIRPQDNPDYQIFIQSNSNNRHLLLGTKALILL